ncbi:MAG TPA: YkgJ family cysteine cluster protein [Methanocorpusculum sp.]|nr:YkgJ family cysteine cluster protein [Methanocorpusculum sp.]
MDKNEMIEKEIRKAGFSCLRCGACCSGPNNEVMVSQPEIEELSATTNLLRDEIVEPYPEWIKKDGFTFTFGWVLKRNSDGNCIFLEKKQCQVYNNRPYICRTYPFMLDGERLIISMCPGCGTNLDTPNATEIKKDLLLRREEEERDLKKTEKHYQKHSTIKDSTIVFDSSGAHEYYFPPKRS